MSSFLQNMGKASREIYKTLETVFGNKGLPCTHAFKCFKNKEGDVRAMNMTQVVF
jgi:hypothetical protein